MVRERELEVSASQPEVTSGESLGQNPPVPQIPPRAEVDARVPGRMHFVQDLRPVGDAGVDADREFEGAVADGRVGNCDIHDLVLFSVDELLVGAVIEAEVTGRWASRLGRARARSG